MAEALRIYKILAADLPQKQAVKLAATIANVSKNKLYEFSLRA